MGSSSVPERCVEMPKTITTYLSEELALSLIEEDMDYMDYKAEARKIHGPDVKVGI